MWVGGCLGGNGSWSKGRLSVVQKNNEKEDFEYRRKKKKMKFRYVLNNQKEFDQTITSGTP